MQGKRFLEVPMEGSNLYIEIDSNSTEDALRRLGAKEETKEFSGDLIDRYSLGDESKYITRAFDYLFTLIT